MSQQMAPAKCPAVITVVLTTRDRLSMLKEAVTSVLSQTFPNWELVIVDDASQDRSWEWLQRLQDFRIRVFRLEGHSERSAARNRGLAAALGEFVLFLDDDDRLFPRALESLVRALQRNPSVVAAVGARVFFDSTNRRWQSQHPGVRHTRVVWKEVLAGWAPVHGQCLFRTLSVRASGGYDPRLSVAEDHALWLKLAFLGPIIIAPERVLEYRLHPEQKQVGDAKAIGLQVRQEFVATLEESERKQGERLTEAWSRWRDAEAGEHRGEAWPALSSYLAVVRIAPGLLYSPVTGPGLSKKILKALLALLIGHRAFEMLRRFKARAARLARRRGLEAR